MAKKKIIRNESFPFFSRASFEAFEAQCANFGCCAVRGKRDDQLASHPNP
jgi:hypothetical protein